MKKLIVAMCVILGLAWHVAAAETQPEVQAQPAATEKREKEFTVENKYLIMPIRNKGKGSTIKLYIDGKAVRQYGLNLAPTAAEADWYAFFTIGNYKGRKARVEVMATEAGFALIGPSDTIPGEENFYQEQQRPQFHFTQKVGWNNDPNGMVYHNGKWHLFFQHNPVGLPWGNMTWGHATSRDLLHWEQQPDKVFPKTMCKGDAFSGSATVDKKNTAGWGADTLVAFLTDTGCGECVVYSNDNGETFTYYENNPVVKHNGRDPKVSWYAYSKEDQPLDDKAKVLGGHWVMVVYDDRQEVGRNAAFHTSTNLKEWTEQSHLPGYYECTDLFELPVDGDANNTRWVVFAADARYAVGRFDGKTFKAFVSVKNPVGLGVEGNKYNTTTFDEITTSKLKLEFDSLETGSTGILEFKVYDAGKSPKFPPVVKINRVVALAAAAIAPSPLLRKEFAVTKDVRRARVYVSGIGWSELYLNGRKVSDRVLDPAATDYDKRVLYVTHDVTERLKKGSNALGVMLGNGWYCEPGRLRYGDVLSPGLTDYFQEIQYCTYDVTALLKRGSNALGLMLGNGWFSAPTFFNNQPWTDRPQAIMQMTVTYDDGTEKQFFTDETWKAACGAIVSNLKNSGEVYDARLEKPQWNMVGYDDSQWSQASVMFPCKGRFTCRSIPPMKVQNTPRPVRVTADGKAGWMFEFDRYFSGWVRLNVKGKPGTTITLNHEEGEKDVYILKGAPEGEVYEPRFALHGVRHVLVKGIEGEPTLDTLAGREVYSDVDLYGSFTCSNELFNKIHGNIQRSLKVGLKGFVLDCLHREPVSYNEPASIFGALSIRKGMPEFWTGYARMIQLGASADGDLSDVVPVFPGMKRDSDVSQNANYSMLIWNLYENYGDHRLLEQHYPTVKAWVDFIGRQLAEPSHIVRKGWLGEHMLPKRGTPGWEFISKETPKDLIWTCFYYQNARVLSSMSRVLGKKDDEKHYAALAEEIRLAINKTWLDETTGHYATKSQTSEILPLAIGIVPPANRTQLIDNIAQTITGADGGKFRVGHVGLPGYMESLVENGLGEIVYKTVNTTEFPGWGYMISEGATTVWEGWSMVNGGYSSRAESMTMLAGVCRFFYDSIAGIQEPNFYGTREFEPGYGVIRIKPHVLGDLTHASASIKTIRGIVSSDWKKTGNSLVLNVTIPANASGRVSVPSLGLKNATLTEGGKVVWKDGAYVKGVAGITTGKQEPLMIGDSITQCMDVDGVGAKVWKEFFVPRKAINLGFGGDRTQHVLWRLEQMPKLKKAPKGAVLLIGTNNVCWGSDTPRNAALGIQGVTRKLQELCPETKILVLAVFPRRNEPDNKFRKQINEINSYLPELLKDMKNVTLLDIGPKFLDDKGFLLKGVMPDTTHPSEKGCEIWAEAIAPELKKMLGE